MQKVENDNCKMKNRQVHHQKRRRMSVLYKQKTLKEKDLIGYRNLERKRFNRNIEKLMQLSSVISSTPYLPDLLEFLALLSRGREET